MVSPISPVSCYTLTAMSSRPAGPTPLPRTRRALGQRPGPRPRLPKKRGEEPLFYQDVFRTLNEGAVKYLVVGGVALVLHGAVRLTVDLDLMVALDGKNLGKFIGSMTAGGYRPKLPVPAADFAKKEKRELWISEKNMKVFSFFHPDRPFEIVDVFVDEPLPFREAYSRREVVRAGALNIPVVSRKDLIALKKISGRPQDLEDIKMLEALSRKARAGA